jgi:hypothetical protein
MKLTFSAEEYTLIARLAARMVLVRNQLSEQDWNKGNNVIIKQLNRKFGDSTLVDQTTEVDLQRKQLRLIEEIMQHGSALLTDKVISGYEGKLAKASTDEDRKRYQDYITASKLMLDHYTNILERVRKAL